MAANKGLKYWLKVTLALTSIILVVFDYFNEFAYSKFVILGVRKRTIEEGNYKRETLTSEELPSKCPRFSIKDSTNKTGIKDIKCKARKPSSKDCERAARKYGRLPKDRGCPKKEYREMNFDLCSFTENSYRTSNKSRFKLKCNLTLCDGDSIRVGVIQQNFGLLLDQNLWYKATTEENINSILQKILERHGPNANDFCIITCRRRERVIKQALIFPPFVKTRKRSVLPKKKINVNVLVLDSVSRQHFYRQLPKTVSELRKLDKSDVKVLDYELFQSLAPRTFPNMRAMFSGIVDVDSNDELHTYGMASLFGKYKNLGYQTLVQEDSCWYDSWGSLITDNKHDLHPTYTIKDYADQWQKILAKTRHLPIDSYGLTHFSCEVFSQYGKTNQFNDLPKVCYNGKFLPSYFLNYTLKYLHTVERTKFSYPAFAYTHLNTGHETSGKRIAFSDAMLSEYVRKMSQLDNTLTVILSDHGPKTTIFSRNYLTGRYEIAHALLFMILPTNIQKYLGEKRVKSLEANENRLINLVDVFHMLTSLNSRNSTGLLTPLPTSRGCDDMPTYSFTTCLCAGDNEHLSNSHDEIHWIAELAVGFLNNEITKSIPINSDNSTKGYGNCERLVGKRYDKIRKKTDRTGHVMYVFDVIVHKYREQEVFEVAIRKKNNSLKPAKTNATDVFRDAELIRWRRVSIFQHYSKCCDKYINIELCICRKESYNQLNPARGLSRLLATPSFQVITKSRFIDSKCLSLLTRSKQHVFVSYELTNLCLDRVYNVTFDLRLVNVNKHVPLETTYNTPRNLTLSPWLIHFVTSVQLYGTGLDESNVQDAVNFKIVYIKRTATTKPPVHHRHMPVHEGNAITVL